MSRGSAASSARYYIFVLSAWETSNRAGEPAAWRFSLQDPQTAERRDVTDLGVLAAYLAAWLGDRAAITCDRQRR